MEKFKTLLANIKENKPLFIALICLGILVVILFSIFLLPSIINPNKVYHDPLSGETIYDPAGRTPETYDTVKHPNYLGFSALVDRGVSFDTVEAFKDRLATISIKDEKATEISVDVDSIQHKINDDSDEYSFHIRINRKYDYQATLTIKADETFTFALSGSGVEDITY